MASLFFALNAGLLDTDFEAILNVHHKAGEKISFSGRAGSEEVDVAIRNDRIHEILSEIANSHNDTLLLFRETLEIELKAIMLLESNKVHIVIGFRVVICNGNSEASLTISKLIHDVAVEGDAIFSIGTLEVLDDSYITIKNGGTNVMAVLLFIIFKVSLLKLNLFDGHGIDFKSVQIKTTCPARVMTRLLNPPAFNVLKSSCTYALLKSLHVRIHEVNGGLRNVKVDCLVVGITEALETKDETRNIYFVMVFVESGATICFATDFDINTKALVIVILSAAIQTHVLHKIHQLMLNAVNRKFLVHNLFQPFFFCLFLNLLDVLLYFRHLIITKENL